MNIIKSKYTKMMLSFVIMFSLILVNTSAVGDLVVNEEKQAERKNFLETNGFSKHSGYHEAAQEYEYFSLWGAVVEVYTDSINTLSKLNPNMSSEDKHKAAVKGAEYLAYRYNLQKITDNPDGVEGRASKNFSECISILMQVLTYEPDYNIPVAMKHSVESVLQQARQNARDAK